ncbi:hypothetical protein [Halorubrum laminariae]|uniref:DUF8060 domain-containing protein n=1 Tax=Halorubrum laminariae TaxID=1433523 RepID=A0ABD6C0X0_9EURY|nr:hypothetical protein [Halorubrum laminariae]
MTDDDRRSDDANRESIDQTDPSRTMTDTPTPTDTTPNESDDSLAKSARPDGAGRGPRGTDTERDSEDGSRLDRLGTDRLRAILDRVGLAALVLLALVAGWSFYGQTGTAIRTWLDPAYQPLALAAFNLAVLLVAVAGIVHQLARIRASE